jgi:hypothetical protein
VGHTVAQHGEVAVPVFFDHSTVMALQTAITAIHVLMLE